MFGRGKKGNQGSDLDPHVPHNYLQKKIGKKKGAAPLFPVQNDTNFVWLVGGAWVRGSNDPSRSTSPRLDVSVKALSGSVASAAHMKLGPGFEKPLQRHNVELFPRQKETTCVEKLRLQKSHTLEQIQRLRAESEQRRCRSETTIRHSEKIRKRLAVLDPAEPPIQQSHNPNLTDIQKVQHCDLKEQLEQTQQESERLRQESTKLQEELDCLRVAQKQDHDFIEEKDKKIESLEIQARLFQQVASEREKLQGYYQDQSRTVTKLKDDLKAAQEENRILRDKPETAKLVDTLQLKLNEAKTQLSAAKNENTHLQDEVNAYKNEIKAERGIVKKLLVQRRSPNSPFQQELSEKEAALGQLQTQLNLAHVELSELKAQKERELGEIATENARLHQRLKEISDSKEVIEKKYHSMVGRMLSLDQMKLELQNEVEVRKQEALEYKEDFERERKDRTNAAGRHVEEIAGWQLACQKLKDDFDKLETENQEKITEHWQIAYQKLQKEHQNHQEAFQQTQLAFKEEINTLTQEKEQEFQQMQQVLEDEIDALKQEKEQKEKSLQEEIDELKDVFLNQQTHQTGLYEQITKLNGQITELKDQISELKEENIQQRNSFDAARDESAQHIEDPEQEDALKVLKKKYLYLHTEKMELLEKLEARDEELKQFRDQKASNSDTYPNVNRSVSPGGIPLPDDPRAEAVRLRDVIEEKDNKIERLEVQARSFQQVASEREKLQGHSQDHSRTVMKLIVMGLRKELEQAKEEIRVLREGSKTSEQIESLKLKLKDVKKKLAAAEHDKKHLENEVDIWKQEVDGERENMRQLKGQLASLQAQRRSHSNDSYRKEREEAVGHVETQQYLVEAELAALRGDVAQKEKELSVVHKENIVLKQKNKEVSDAHDEVQKMYLEILDRMTAQMQAFRARVSTLTAKVKENEERTKVMQDELDVSKHEALQYKEDFERERKDREAVIGHHDSLQEAYQEIQTQKNLVDAELAALKCDVAQKEKELTVVGRENIVLQQRYNKVSVAHDELQQKYHNILEQLQTLDRITAQMQVFKAQVFTLTAKVKENEERTKVVHDELEVSKHQSFDQADIAQKEALQYKEDFERERKDREAAIGRHDSLQEAYQALETLKNLVDAELAALRCDVTQREKELIVVGKENIVLKQRCKEVSDAHHELQQKYHNMVQQLETLDQMTAQMQAFRARVSTLTAKVKENEERTKVIQDELDVSKCQAMQYKEDFERERKDREDAVSRHAEEVAKLQTVCQKIEKEMQQKQEVFLETHTVLEDASNKTKRENEQLKEEMTKLQGETQGLQEILKQTQDALDDQVAKLNHEITELKQENVKQRNSLDAVRNESDYHIAELTKQLKITMTAKAEFEKCTADLNVSLEQAKHMAQLLTVDKRSLEEKMDDIDKDRRAKEKNLEIALNEKAALNEHLERLQEEIVQVRQQLEHTVQESSVELMGKNQQVKQFRKQVEEITGNLQDTRAELDRVRGQYNKTGTKLEKVKVELEQARARMQEQAQVYQEQLKQTDEQAESKEAFESEKLLIENGLCQLNGKHEDLRHMCRYDVLFKHNDQLKTILRKHNVSPPPLTKLSQCTPPQYQTEQPHAQAQPRQMGNIQHGGNYTVNLKQQIPAVSKVHVVPEQQHLYQHDPAYSLPRGRQYDIQQQQWYCGVTAQGMVGTNEGYGHGNVSPHHQHQLRQIMPRPSPASRYSTLKQSILELEKTTAALESKKKAAYSQLIEELELSQENIQQLENRISDLENHVKIGAKHQKMIVDALEDEKQDKSRLQDVLDKTFKQSQKMYKQSQSAIKHLKEQIHWLNKTVLHWYETPKMVQSSRDKLKPFVIQGPVQVGAEVGRGCYGAVYSCTVGNVGIKCIAKQIHNALVGGGEYEGVSDREKSTIISNFQRECTILSTARHPNVVQFVGVCYGSDQHDLQLQLIMERLPTDLEKLLATCHEENDHQDGFKLPLSVQFSFLTDISSGLLYLHSQSIVHRDLNSGNVLLTADLQAKIADLGVSKLHQDRKWFQKLTQAPGASGYMPPEAVAKNPVYDEKIDIFSFGVLSLYIATQNFPEILEEHVPDQIHHNGEGEIFKRQEWFDALKIQQHPFHDLVRQCLLDKQRRPQTTEVVEIVQRMREDHVCTIQETLAVFAHFHDLTHEKN